MRFHPDELKRDAAWKAARARLEEKLGYIHGVTTRSIPDYWVIDELHEEALAIEAGKIELRNQMLATTKEKTK
jgi:hypothetical protein